MLTLPFTSNWYVSPCLRGKLGRFGMPARQCMNVRFPLRKKMGTVKRSSFSFVVDVCSCCASLESFWARRKWSSSTRWWRSSTKTRNRFFTASSERRSTTAPSSTSRWKFIPLCHRRQWKHPHGIGEGGGQIFKEFIGRTSVKFWMGGTLDKFNTNLGQSWERIGKINQVILNNNNNLASCSRVQYADTRPLVSKFAGNLHLHNMYNQHNRRAMVNYIQILPWYYIFVHQEAYVLFRLVPAQRKYPLSEYLYNISVT